MDADWLNRAGILAEAVSFVLIAPEIMGARRLSAIERRLKSWAKREGERRHPGIGILLIGAIFLYTGVFGLYQSIAWLVLDFSWLNLPAIAVGSSLLVWWVLFGGMMMLADIMILPARAIARVLAGANRLRAFVFGVGLLLLLSGMATQFAATF